MKAILVIDEMPKTCEECEFGWWYGAVCGIQNCDTYRDESGRDENCPLKPMPKEQHAKWSWGDDDFQRGWNACIDEILGEGQ